MQLTEPTYLWALLGLLLPLVIHLLSRKAGKVLLVGSIRHLMDANTRKFSSLRFNEYLLFFLRATAIILFVLILSGWVRTGQKNIPKWVLLEADPAEMPSLQKNLDSLQNAGYELRYLTDGFPLVNEAAAFSQGATNYPYLVQEIQRTGADAIIYAKNHINAFRGKQLPLPENIQWLQLPESRTEKIFLAQRISGDSVLILTGKTGPEQTAFTQGFEDIPAGQSLMNDLNDPADSIPIETADSLHILLLADQPAGRPANILQAALLALADFSGRKMKIEHRQSAPDAFQNYDAVINGRPEIQLRTGKVPLIQLGIPPKGEIISPTGPNTWTVRQDLKRQAVLQENLLVSLGALLFRNNALEEEIENWERRTMDETLFFTGAPEIVRVGNLQPQPLDKWLILGLILIFIAERILAFYRQA